jgi:hemerythrin-like domain-containing protein
MTMACEDRRSLLLGAVCASLLVMPACAGKKGEEKEVSATEDLMREHGVLRRLLVVYREAAAKIRQDDDFDARPLVDAANMFRSFGEDYHERKLEEAHIFPAVKKAVPTAAAMIDTLIGQHNRGREINMFVIARCTPGRIATDQREHVAAALESFARMYEEHAAVEDTIVFQSWKQSLSRHQLDEASDRFEDIEREQFKGDGFDMAVAQVAAIEQRLKLANLDRFTAPAPV